MAPCSVTWQQPVQSAIVPWINIYIVYYIYIYIYNYVYVFSNYLSSLMLKFKAACHAYNLFNFSANCSEHLIYVWGDELAIYPYMLKYDLLNLCVSHFCFHWTVLHIILYKIFQYSYVNIRISNKLATALILRHIFISSVFHFKCSRVLCPI